MFYTNFLLNSFCLVKAIKYYSTVLPRDAYTAGLPLCVCVSLPSTSQWHTTELDITQLISESDAQGNIIINMTRRIILALQRQQKLNRQNIRKI